MATTKKNAAPTVSAEDVLDAFSGFMDLLSEYNADNGTAPAGKAKTTAAATKSASKKKSEPAEVEELDEDEVRGYKIGQLRELAEQLELDEQKLKAGILSELEEKGYFGEPDEDEEDDEEEADEDDEEEGDEDEIDLDELDLPGLRKLAKEMGIKIPRGADQDTLIELIEGAQDEDEEDEEDEDAEEDEDEADDEEEDEEDDDEEELTEDDLKKMSLADLKTLAKEIGVRLRFPKTATTDVKKKKFAIETILSSGDE